MTSNRPQTVSIACWKSADHQSFGTAPQGGEDELLIARVRDCHLV